jgi:hypothetical protein
LQLLFVKTNAVIDQPQLTAIMRGRAAFTVGIINQHIENRNRLQALESGG